MGRLIVLLAIVGALLLFLNWFRKTPSQQVARVLRKSLLWGGIGLLVLAAATGRLNPIFAALGAAIPVVMRGVQLLRMAPVIQQLLQSLGLGGLGSPGTAGAGASRGGQTSSIRTRYLEMRLDHHSGRMDGQVREGPFAGQQLTDLSLEQLLRMLELYRDSDAQSAAVLEAYLDRERDDWRDAPGAHSGARGAGRGGGPAPETRLTKQDAWAILGLEPGADAEQIRAAHRRLMQKLHPDRGGSDYLASQINAAKDMLLGE